MFATYLGSLTGGIDKMLMTATQRVFLVSIAAALATSVAHGADAEFRSLFDGKSLAGWTGDLELWKVADGAIIGSTEARTLKKNTFLATDKPYKNFVLRLKFKLRNGNSGVQFRSKRFDEHVVRGYQADIAENQFMGILYEEGGRGFLKNVNADEVRPHVKAGDWNEYVITADGPHITQQLNGFKTVDYTETSDQGAKEGVIALQLHVGDPMQVMFKDIEIKELP
ncbi:MAG: DUF1080 domain-containing protein [Pirellulales bacterium]|nr:DUF1080 domain-containing protein [Pirellulales bacterium]